MVTIFDMQSFLLCISVMQSSFLAHFMCFEVAALDDSDNEANIPSTSEASASSVKPSK